MELSEDRREKVIHGRDVKKILQKREIYIQKLIVEKRWKLKNAPEGELRICKCRKKVKYYHRKQKQDKTGTYIPQKQENLARILAQKNYDEKVLRAAEQERLIIQNALRWYKGKTADDIYDELSVYRREIVIPVEDTEDMFIQKWISTEYVGKGVQKGAADLITERGEQVRSKSELIIANMLNQEKIPYRYEYPVSLQGMGTVYPDFTILNIRTREEILWEHQGMMDDPVYAGKAVRKEQAYIMNGYIPGRNLILTSETKNTALSVRVVKTLIRVYCL